MLVDAAHLSAMTFDAGLRSSVRLARSADGSDTALRAAALYDASLGREDAGLRAASGTDGMPIVLRLRADDIPATDDRHGLYDRFGLSERLTVLGLSRGDWFAVNFYRARDAVPADDIAIAALQACAPVLHALVARHLRLAVPAPTMSNEPDYQAMLDRIEPALSPRQKEACAGALLGLTNAEIASAMGIEPSTVVTLRRRAYERLGIVSLPELFRHCLVAIAPR